jgi:hypothetical protein
MTVTAVDDFHCTGRYNTLAVLYVKLHVEELEYRHFIKERFERLRTGASNPPNLYRRRYSADRLRLEATSAPYL